MPVDSADVVVIGAGVSGLSSAYFLARAGRDVVVVDKGIVGGEASGRNGGMVSERVDEPLLIPMAAEALKIWATLDDELGYPTEFIHEGRLQVAVTEKEMGDLLSERDEALRHGLRVELVDPSEIRDMIPGITGRTLGGLFSRQRRARQFPAVGPGIRMGLSRPGRQALSEHDRHGHPGRRWPGLVG